MIQNNLYNFIQSYIFVKKFEFSSCKKLMVAINKKNEQYFCFDLKALKLTIGEDNPLKLIEHHVSVYQYETSYNPSLSQYHYTAYFTAHDKTYRLHVYFDEYDQLTQLPVLSEQIVKGVFEVTDKAKQYEEQFVTLAIENSIPLVNSLKMKMAKTIQDLNDEYCVLERKASDLSQNIELNYLSYKDMMMQTLHTVNEMIFIGCNYESIQKHITQILNCLNPDYIESQKKPVLISEVEKNESPQSPEPIIINTHVFFKTEPKVVVLSETIDKLIHEYSLVNYNDVDEQVLQLNRIHFKTYDLEIMDAPSFSDLQKLHQLRKKLREDGEKLVQNFLLSNQFDKIRRIPNFEGVLTNRYFQFALCSQNAALLDFILTYSPVAGSNQSLKIHDVHYASPLHYCFKANESNKSVTECVAVLIQHKASLMVKGNDGLPLVYSILTIPHHPFHGVLKSSGLLHMPSFYHQLASTLDSCLKKKAFQEVEHRQISSLKEKCILSIKQLKSNTTPALSLVQKSPPKVCDFFESIQSKLTNDELNEIGNDPTIVLLLKQLDLMSSKLPVEQNPFKIQGDNKASKIEDSTRDDLQRFLIIKGNDVSTITKEIIKKVSIIIEFVELLIPLQNIQKNLRKNPFESLSLLKRLEKVKKKMLHSDNDESEHRVTSSKYNF